MKEDSLTGINQPSVVTANRVACILIGHDSRDILPGIRDKLGHRFCCSRCGMVSIDELKWEYPDIDKLCELGLIH